MNEKLPEEKNYELMGLKEMLAEIKEEDIRKLYSEIKNEKDQETFNSYGLERQKKLVLIFKLDKEGSLDILRDKLGAREIRELFGFLDVLIENSDFGTKGRNLCKVGDKYLEDR